MAQTTLYHMYIQMFWRNENMWGGGGGGGECEHQIRYHIAFMATHNIKVW